MRAKAAMPAPIKAAAPRAVPCGQDIVERLLEAALLLGTHRYGSREGLAAAMLDVTVSIATFAPEASS